MTSARSRLLQEVLNAPHSERNKRIQAWNRNEISCSLLSKTDPVNKAMEQQARACDAAILGLISASMTGKINTNEQLPTTAAAITVSCNALSDFLVPRLSKMNQECPPGHQACVQKTLDRLDIVLQKNMEKKLTSMMEEKDEYGDPRFPNQWQLTVMYRQREKYGLV